jgi:hypothetical protein
VVAQVLLEVAEEGHDLVEGEVGEGEAGDLAALVGRGEHQEQPHGVAVAAHRGLAESLDRDQVAGEKRVRQPKCTMELGRPGLMARLLICGHIGPVAGFPMAIR